MRIDQFNASLETLTKGVCEVFDSHITPRLLRANGVSAKLTPRMRAGKVTQTDFALFATAISDLVSSGAITNDRETENHTRSVIGYPPLPDEPEQPEPAEPFTPVLDLRNRRGVDAGAAEAEADDEGATAPAPAAASA